MTELLRVTSVFENGSFIPEKYSYENDNVNPPLLIENIPSGVKTLVLIVDDSDAIGTWTHWIVFDIAIPENTPNFEIKENTAPGILGINDFKQTEYGGPCPPAGTHRYYFRVYGLNKNLGLDEGVTKEELERFMKDNIVAKGELMGKFSKI